MPTTVADVYVIIDDCEKDLKEAAKVVMNSTAEIRRYVIWMGLEAIQSRRRRDNRRSIKRELKPQFKKGKVTGAVEFTKNTRERFADINARVFGPEGWMIGNVNIGDFTRPMLIAQAISEERSAKGSMMNGYIYRSLAAEMPNDETLVRKQWDGKELLKWKRRIESEAGQKEVTLS